MNWTVPFINYRLGEEALEVTVANRPVRRIPYGSIESVERGWSLLNEHWSRRMDFWRWGVTIKRKSGLVRRLLITPDAPEDFIKELQAHLPAESHKKPAKVKAAHAQE